MGGNAIPNAERMTRSEHEQAIEQARQLLQCRLWVQDCFANKKSFGDVDVVVIQGEGILKKCGFKQLALQFMTEDGQSKTVQLDINCVEDENEAIILNWQLSYAPQAEILGRNLKSWGLKLTRKGLFLLRKHKPAYFLSNDMNAIFGWIGLSPTTKETLQSPMDLVSYFSESPFIYVKANSMSKTYFNVWKDVESKVMQGTDLKKQSLFQKKTVVPSDAIQFFGHSEAFSRLKESENARKEFLEKYNGKIVQETIVGLSAGPELGAFLKFLEENLDLDSKNKKSVTENILCAYKKYLLDLNKER